MTAPTAHAPRITRTERHHRHPHVRASPPRGVRTAPRMNYRIHPTPRHVAGEATGGTPTRTPVATGARRRRQLETPNKER